MKGLRRTVKTCRIHQRGQTDLLAPAQRDQSLGDEGAVEAFERHHVGDSAKRHQIEHRQQIGRRPRTGEIVARAQFAGQRHQGHEHDAGGAEITQARQIVGAVRIDDRDRLRQLDVGLMMIEDHDIHAERTRFQQRHIAGGAAIDRDQQRHVFFGKAFDRVDIRAVALKDAIRNMHDRIKAALPQIAGEQRRRGGAIDIIIAEDRDLFTAHDRIGDPRAGRRHVGQHRRIGHQILDGRIEIGLRLVGFHATACQHAGQQFGRAKALRNRGGARHAARIQPVAPGAPGRRRCNVEEVAFARQVYRQGGDICHAGNIGSSRARCTSNAFIPAKAGIQRLDLEELGPRP